MTLLTPPAMRYLGREPSHPRDVYLLSLKDLSDFPSRLNLRCPRFVLLLTADTNNAHRVELANRILEAGCVYFCAWGPGCEVMHDMVDWCFLERIDFADDQGVIMTTWHEDDTIADAVEFALLSASPDDYYLEGCDAVVLAVAGNDAWSALVQSTASTFMESNVI